MKINNFLIYVLFAAFALHSCSNDDDMLENLPEGDYTNGFFVLNEGGIGSVTYVSDDLSVVYQDVFKTVNPDTDLGAYTQSIFFDGDRAFVISNGSNLISVVNRYTFELIDVIDEGLTVPRYGQVIGNKAYVTNNNSYSDADLEAPDDFVAVIDLETLEVEETIPVLAFADEIEEEDGLLYINGASFDGTSKVISVLDASNNTFANPINTSGGLRNFKIDDDIIYAITSEGLERINMNSGNLISKVQFEDELAGASRIDLEDDMIYFTVGTSVYTMAEDATEPPVNPLIDYATSSPSYGVMYGFEVEDDRIYVADGGDFQSNSFVEVYSLTGDLLKNIPVGPGPNGFYFN